MTAGLVPVQVVTITAEVIIAQKFSVKTVAIYAKIVMKRHMTCMDHVDMKSHMKCIHTKSHRKFLDMKRHRNFLDIDLLEREAGRRKKTATTAMTQRSNYFSFIYYC